MVDWITLASFNACRPDLKGLLPGEARTRTYEAIRAVKRVRSYSGLFGPACAVPDLRRGRVNRARKEMGAEDEALGDIIGLMGRMTHLRGAPERSLARATDPESYAFGLVFRDLRIGCVGIYTEVPGPRAALIWWGDSDETLPRVEALCADTAAYDEVWERARIYPAGEG